MTAVSAVAVRACAAAGPNACRPRRERPTPSPQRWTARHSGWMTASPPWQRRAPAARRPAIRCQHLRAAGPDPCAATPENPRSGCPLALRPLWQTRPWCWRLRHQWTSGPVQDVVGRRRAAAGEAVKQASARSRPRRPDRGRRVQAGLRRVLLRCPGRPRNHTRIANSPSMRLARKLGFTRGDSVRGVRHRAVVGHVVFGHAVRSIHGRTPPPVSRIRVLGCYTTIIECVRTASAYFRNPGPNAYPNAPRAAGPSPARTTPEQGQSCEKDQRGRTPSSPRPRSP